MYYDRLGRSLVPVAQQPRVPAPRAPSDLLKSYLEAHRTVWHTQSLHELYPEIVAYLESRYAAARHPGGLCVRTRTGAYPDLDFAHVDLRLVTETLLSREYREALFDECISPSIERLTA